MTVVIVRNGNMTTIKGFRRKFIGFLVYILYNKLKGYEVEYTDV